MINQSSKKNRSETKWKDEKVFLGPRVITFIQEKEIVRNPK